MNNILFDKEIERLKDIRFLFKLQSEKIPFYHFSVDDVFDSLIEVIDRKIDLFEHPFFSFLKELHEEFNMSVDLYVFFQKKISGRLRTLKEISDSLKQTIGNNSWIRFGPHGLDYETPPFSQTPEEQIAILDKIYNEIYRFAGKNNLSKWIRLHIFSESYELKDFFHSHGVEAIFTTDKDRITTRMPDAVNNSLKSTGFADYNGLSFIRSDIRTENLANERIHGERLRELINKHLEKNNHIIVMTHEYELLREEVKSVTREIIKELYTKKILSL